MFTSMNGLKDFYFFFLNCMQGFVATMTKTWVIKGIQDLGGYFLFEDFFRLHSVY